MFSQYLICDYEACHRDVNLESRWSQIDLKRFTLILSQNLCCSCWLKARLYSIWLYSLDHLVIKVCVLMFILMMVIHFD